MACRSAHRDRGLNRPRLPTAKSVQLCRTVVEGRWRGYLRFWSHGPSHHRQRKPTDAGLAACHWGRKHPATSVLQGEQISQMEARSPRHLCSRNGAGATSEAEASPPVRVGVPTATRQLAASGPCAPAAPGGASPKSQRESKHRQQQRVRADWCTKEADVRVNGYNKDSSEFSSSLPLCHVALCESCGLPEGCQYAKQLLDLSSNGPRPWKGRLVGLKMEDGQA